jgi:hypothetical protein
MEQHFKNYRAGYRRWQNKFKSFIVEANEVFDHYKQNQYFDVGYDCTNQQQIQLIEQAIRFSNHTRPASTLSEDVMLNHPDDNRHALRELRDLKSRLNALKLAHPLKQV